MLESNEIMQHYMKVDMSNFLSDRYDIDEILVNAANTEIDSLIKQVLQFADSIAKGHYHLVLDRLVSNLYSAEDESVFLEKLIPQWQSLRNNALISSFKPIDEFYYEVEIFMLMKLIINPVANNEVYNISQIAKMRSIVRRYSNMPNFWQILCIISGDEVKTSYTF